LILLLCLMCVFLVFFYFFWVNNNLFFKKGEYILTVPSNNT
jgi:hypothetical protein